MALVLREHVDELHKEQKREFEAHDARETASRFRLPAPRQIWVEDPVSGNRVNSAEGQARGMPPYLLIIDLVFTAASSQAARLVDFNDLAGVPYFFMLLTTIIWLWVVLCNRLNCYDAEDLSFEIFTFLMATSLIALSFHIPSCFIDKKELRAVVGCTNWSIPVLAVECLNSSGAACTEMAETVHLNCRTAPYVQKGSIFSSSFDECFDFVFFLAISRMLLVVLHLYIATYVPMVRRSIAAIETLSLISWVPQFAVMLIKTAQRDALPHAQLELELQWLLTLATLCDILSSYGPNLIVKCVPRTCRPAIEKFISPVPQSIAYAEARNERLIIIGIGNVIGEVRATRFRTHQLAPWQMSAR